MKTSSKSREDRALPRITRSLLRRHPLPRIAENSDKNARGVVLVMGGSASVPGAVLLAGIAALRAGAGKLQFGVPRAIAIPLGMAAPEALVASERQTLTLAHHADAVLIGPGMPDRPAVAARARAIARTLGDDATLVLDAAAIPAAGVRARAVITPHVNEMASLLGVKAAQVERDAPDVALEAAQRFGCTVALKGSTTFVSDGVHVFRYDGGSVGLATSGSGDTLSGLVAGLSAGGADPLTAALWGVWTHGVAGARLSAAVGRVGFLARELLDEVPQVLRDARE